MLSSLKGNYYQPNLSLISYLIQKIFEYHLNLKVTFASFYQLKFKIILEFITNLLDNLILQKTPKH